MFDTAPQTTASTISMFGHSPAFEKMRARLPRVARAERNTLIAGPTGSGKEVVAETLHALSSRASRPFVTVHCGSLPENLVESELFGHRRGAFTGADTARRGLIHTAQGGILFLDEVNSLPMAAQVKLLRFLESGEYRAIGSDICHVSDTWVIAATNEELRDCVRERRFREDLLFRLDVVRVDVPPLCLRQGDVLLLAEYFLERATNRALELTPDARRALLQHTWPGNIRELKHRVESAAAMAEDNVIDASQLGLATQGGLPLAGPSLASTLADSPNEAALERSLWKLIEQEGFTLGEAVGMCEKMLVQEALRREDNNRTAAAKRLGIHVRTIFKKLSS